MHSLPESKPWDEVVQYFLPKIRPLASYIIHKSLMRYRPSHHVFPNISIVDNESQQETFLTNINLLS